MQNMIKFDLPSDEPAGALVLGIGVFDGVHNGHRKIISELVEMGQRAGALPVAVTFIPHPREVLGPPPPPRLLMPPEVRIRRLREAGAAGIGIIGFSEQIAETTPREFIEALLTPQHQICGICVGSRWRFGRHGTGDAAFLSGELVRRGIAFNAVPEVRVGAEIVSSSMIREAIAAGDLAGAFSMLGSRPKLYGSVERGHRVAGSVLQAPTANLHVEYGVLPPNGVYVTRVAISGKNFPAVTNIGFAPTFGTGEDRRVETHIIGFSGDLYQQKLAVELVAKLRDEKTFASAADLKVQISADIDNAKRILSSEVNK